MLQGASIMPLSSPEESRMEGNFTFFLLSPLCALVPRATDPTWAASEPQQ